MVMVRHGWNRVEELCSYTVGTLFASRNAALLLRCSMAAASAPVNFVPKPLVYSVRLLLYKLATRCTKLEIDRGTLDREVVPAAPSALPTVLPPAEACTLR